MIRPLLGAGDAGRRTAVAGVAAQAHFDEDEHLPILADQVDLAAAAAIVACQDAQAACRSRKRAASSSATSPAIGRIPRGGRVIFAVHLPADLR
jgi:hypothetical protein